MENDFTRKRGARGDHLAKGPNTDCKVILSHAHERRREGIRIFYVIWCAIFYVTTHILMGSIVSGSH